MGASDHLSPTQFFHGSAFDLSPGEMVNPGHGDTTAAPKFAYATSDPMNAAYYADRSAKTRNTAHGLSIHKPRVYEVEPLGEVESDPWDEGYPSFRSRDGFRVRGLHEG